MRVERQQHQASSPGNIKASGIAVEGALPSHPSHPARATMAQLSQANARARTISSVKDEADLLAALDTSARVVFLLYGSLLDLEATIDQVKSAGRICFVDVDLLEGFAGRPVVIEYLAGHTAADGIVSAKTAMVKAARDHGLIGGHRFFLVESRAYRRVEQQTALSGADFIEVLPGCIPRVIRWLREEVKLPIIAGGLIVDREDVRAALAAGAAAVATTNRGLWEP
ncbi:MAG: glycerol-3-phosphate responsive antiterminator [Bifidobacteriaceae bacterium]|jgi:glycerol uptake operon antiterminator|nr:glycerol-3-phosphate responsive antiterminator [Bifidobacteriaceae bacterium]